MLQVMPRDPTPGAELTLAASEDGDAAVTGAAATLVVGAIEVGLRVAARTSGGRAGEREAEPAASGLHARPSGPDQVTGA